MYHSISLSYIENFQLFRERYLSHPDFSTNTCPIRNQSKQDMCRPTTGGELVN